MKLYVLFLAMALCHLGNAETTTGTSDTKTTTNYTSTNDPLTTASTTTTGITTTSKPEASDRDDLTPNSQIEDTATNNNSDSDSLDYFQKVIFLSVVSAGGFFLLTTIVCVIVILKLCRNQRNLNVELENFSKDEPTKNMVYEEPISGNAYHMYDDVEREGKGSSVRSATYVNMMETDSKEHETVMTMRRGEKGNLH